MNKASEIARQHWDGYVKPLLEAHGEDAATVEKIGFHYISAWIHGAKHEREMMAMEGLAESAMKSAIVHGGGIMPCS